MALSNKKQKGLDSTKKCKSCDLVQDYTLFPDSGKTSKVTGEPYRRKECRECYNFRKNVYKKNKKRTLKIIKEHLFCVGCGYSKQSSVFFTTSALEFHHKDGNKEHNISNMIQQFGFSLKKIVEEINKTIIVCCKCHREHHYGNRSFKKNKKLNIVYKKVKKLYNKILEMNK